jgi:hypothetical protein
MHALLPALALCACAALPPPPAPPAGPTGRVERIEDVPAALAAWRPSADRPLRAVPAATAARAAPREDAALGPSLRAGSLVEVLAEIDGFALVIGPEAARAAGRGIVPEPAWVPEDALQAFSGARAGWPEPPWSEAERGTAPAAARATLSDPLTTGAFALDISAARVDCPPAVFHGASTGCTLRAVVAARFDDRGSRAVAYECRAVIAVRPAGAVTEAMVPALAWGGFPASGGAGRAALSRSIALPGGPTPPQSLRLDSLECLGWQGEAG